MKINHRNLGIGKTKTRIMIVPRNNYYIIKFLKTNSKEEKKIKIVYINMLKL